MRNETTNNDGIREQGCRILVDRPFLNFLRGKPDGKFSRLDAFCYLLDKSVAEDARPQNEVIRTPKQTKWTSHPFEVTITDLAKSWNWHRATTRKFLNELAEMGMLKKESLQKSCIIQMCVPDNKKQQNDWSGNNNINDQLAAFICGRLPQEKADVLFGYLSSYSATLPSGNQTDLASSGNEIPYGIIHHIMLWQLHGLPTEHYADNDAISILHKLYTGHHKGNWSTMLSRLKDLSGLLRNDIPPSKHPSFEDVPHDETVLLDNIYRYYHDLL